MCYVKDKKENDLLDNYREKLVWPNQINSESVVIHNDIDGVLSGLYLLNKGAAIVGMYDLERFHFTNKQEKNRFDHHVYVDLDIDYREVRSFGHHIIANLNKNAFNLNHVFNLDADFGKLFTNKCPLNTIILLYALYDQKPQTDEEIAFLVYADSVILNFEKYKQNMTNWLRVLGQDEILDALENRIDNLYRIIDELIKPALEVSYPFYEHKQNLNGDIRKYTQCNHFIDFKNKTFTSDITPIFKLSKELLNLNSEGFPIKFLESIKYVKNYKMVYDQEEDLYKKENIVTKFDSSRIKNFQKALKEVKKYIVSHSFTYSDAVQLTLDQDVEMEFNEETQKITVKDKDETLKIQNMTIIIDENGKLRGYQKKSRLKG